ncbi:MAG: M20/M25/M40 family metallo-hydrolase [Saprospiraceae bacterium]
MKFYSLSFRILGLAVIITAVIFAFYSLYPNEISTTSVDDNYSTERVLKHIEKISERVHYVGSEGHDYVRDYIMSELQKNGLQPSIQNEFSVNSKWKGATYNQNIIAKIKGVKSQKTMILLSHYDSAPFSSHGASDDAVGVGCILEAVRTIKESGIHYDNDILILITDGEEIGLNGAKAFVENYSDIDNIGTVINFEARGSGGPSFVLLETNGGNKNMVEVLKNANFKFPVANSFLYSVYKKLPNDTDLTMFRELADIDGFNFAFIDDFYDYHCSTDDFDHIDVFSVEHQGQYLMSMLSELGNFNLNNLKSENDLVYFNFPFLNIISYPYYLNIPILLFSIILFLFYVVLLIKKGKIKLKNTLISFSLLLILAAVSFISGKYLWDIILYFHPAYQDILHEFPYNGKSYLIAYLAFLLLIYIIAYFKFKTKFNEHEMIIPFLVTWIIIDVLLWFILPGALFFVLPLIIIELALVISVFFQGKETFKSVLFVISAIPAIFIIAPFLEMFPVGLRFISVYISSIMILLLFGLLIPAFYYINLNRYIVYILVVIVGTFSILAEKKSGFSQEQPFPASINYIYLPESNESYWETYNHHLDSWLQNIMGDSIVKGGVMDLNLKSKFNTSVQFHSKAPGIQIASPEINLLSDTIIGEYREIQLDIVHKRKVNYYELLSTNKIEFKEIRINGKNYYFDDFKGKNNNTIVQYYMTSEKEIPDFYFKIQKDEILDLIIYEGSNNLSENTRLLSFPRPENAMPMPFVANDMIITVNKIKI